MKLDSQTEELNEKKIDIALNNMNTLPDIKLPIVEEKLEESIAGNSQRGNTDLSNMPLLKEE